MGKETFPPFTASGTNVLDGPSCRRAASLRTAKESRTATGTKTSHPPRSTSVAKGPLRWENYPDEVSNSATGIEGATGSRSTDLKPAAIS